MSNWIEWSRALGGGVLIGASAAVLLVFNGRIAGISGITSGLLSANKGDRLWRGTFVAGLLIGGALLSLFAPSTVGVATISLPWIALAGVLVGVGTTLGNGCTSGHGVCGVARMSPRSIVATLTFITTGAITVALTRALRQGVA
jgi:uncharacterized membrane protein YedE/YeeE